MDTHLNLVSSLCKYSLLFLSDFLNLKVTDWQKDFVFILFISLTFFFCIAFG